MTATFDAVRDAVLDLPKGDQIRILSLVALEVGDAHPGIDFQDNVCGGAARIIRTRIPVRLLDSLRRQGRTDAELLAAYPLSECRRSGKRLELCPPLETPTF